MANNVTFDVSGLDDLESALADLGAVSSKKVLRRAAREGAKPILAEAQRGIKNRWGDKSGALHDSVKLSVSMPKNPKFAEAVASIGVFRVRELEQFAEEYYPDGYIGAPNLAYWFEYGIQPHSLGKKSKAKTGKDTGGGDHPGIPARPVIRPSMDNNVEITINRAKNILAYEIDRITKRLGK